MGPMAVKGVLAASVFLIIGLGAWRAAPASELASLRSELANLKVVAARELLKKRDLPGARAMLEAAETSSSRQALPTVWLLQARTAIAGARFPGAAALIAKAREVSPNSVEVATVECELAGHERRTDAAAAACGRALALRPGWPEAQKQLGSVYAATSGEVNVQRAIGLHKAAIAGYSRGCGACETCCLLGAEDEVRQLKELLADDEGLVLQLEQAAGGDADYTAAFDPVVAALQQSVAELEAAEDVNWARLADARLRLADAFRLQGDLAAAEAAYEASVQACKHRPDPDDPTIVTWYEFEALLAHSRGDLAGTRSAYERTLAALRRYVDPGNAEVKMLEDAISYIEAQMQEEKTE